MTQPTTMQADNPDIDVRQIQPGETVGAQACSRAAGPAPTGSLKMAVAGGGTGGHLFPALAVLKALDARVADLEVAWLTTTRPIDSRILSQQGVSYLAQPVRPFSSRPWHWPGFYLAWRRSVALATRTMRDMGVDVLLATGGYGSGPAVAAAARLGIPVAMLNPDAEPGLANRTMARSATVVFCQWDVSLSHFKKDQAVAAGCPVRQELLKTDKAHGCEAFDLDPARPVLLVNGGSQGSRNINLAVLAVLDQMRAELADWQVLHVTGQADHEQVAAAYADRPGCKAVAFTNQMPAALAVADLVVSRAGASTLAEITAAGKASILIPYPYDRTKHQNANAAALASAGAAVTVEDRMEAAGNAAALREALSPLLADPQRRAALADASRRLGKPDAAVRIAETLLGLAEKHKQKMAVTRMMARSRR